MLDYVSLPWGDAYSPSAVGVKQRPLFLLGGGSYYGRLFGPRIAELCDNVIAIADDQAAEKELFGVPRWTFGEFQQKASQFPNALALDFWTGPLGEATLRQLAVNAHVESVDFVTALAELGLPTVYQTATEMRTLTVARQREWAALRADLDDERSRRTLDAILKLRLTYDRRHLRAVHASMEDEYFSLYDTDSTFKLGDDEMVCDAGAYVGTTVRKVVAATGGRFRAIHAFEPDRANFAKLQELSSMRLQGLTLHNAAVGDYTGHVRFLETGTMGSHVEGIGADDAASGGGATPITRIDDAMECVSFVKMDLEGFESRALSGAAGLIGSCRPRMAITGYHYANDLLELWTLLRRIAPDYSLRLRHHSSFYYDSIIYAQPRVV
jgi:FkbM family methyltransferase